MKARIALTNLIDELLYTEVLQHRYLSDHAELPDAQYRVIRLLGRKGGATMRQVATFLGVSMPRATSVVDALEKSGLAQRRHGADRRTVEVVLSDEGLAVIDEAHQAHERLSEAILAPLSQSERDQMYYLLSKCAHVKDKA